MVEVGTTGRLMPDLSDKRSLNEPSSGVPCESDSPDTCCRGALAQPCACDLGQPCFGGCLSHCVQSLNLLNPARYGEAGNPNFYRDHIAEGHIVTETYTNSSLRLHYSGDAGKEGHAETISLEPA